MEKPFTQQSEDFQKFKAHFMFLRDFSTIMNLSLTGILTNSSYTASCFISLFPTYRQFMLSRLAIYSKAPNTSLIIMASCFDFKFPV